MKRATVTISDQLEPALAAYLKDQEVAPSLTRLLQTALGEFLSARGYGASKRAPRAAASPRTAARPTATRQPQSGATAPPDEPRDSDGPKAPDEPNAPNEPRAPNEEETDAVLL